MQLPYVTERDESLPHQVVFIVLNNTVYVSCNCRVEHRGPGNAKTYDPMGQSNDLNRSRRLYNDPANHRKPFGKGDAAKW